MTTAIQELEISSLKGSRLSAKIKIPDNLTVLDDPKDSPPPYHGVFRIMTPKDGDKRVVWDSRDFNQIREAKDMFDKLVAQGLVPYKVGINGHASSEVMTEFDPYAEEVVFCPVNLVAGG